ncbi:MAG: hypothetical protein ACTSO9_18145 [Candidatus Helarchaeota archaeon]
MSILNDFNNKPVNVNKFIIQILIAIGISIFFQFFMAPYIIDPTLAWYTGKPQNSSTIIFTLSQWFFSFSVTYFYYPDNKILNNYLFSGLVGVTLFLVYKFINLIFIDFLHILPFIVNILILWKKRDSLNLKYVTIISIILAIWATLDRLIGLAYTEFPIPVGVIIIIGWPLINIFLTYLIEKNRK